MKNAGIKIIKSNGKINNSKYSFIDISLKSFQEGIIF